METIEITEKKYHKDVSIKERRIEICAYVIANPNMTQIKIAEIFGVGQSTVVNCYRKYYKLLIKNNIATDIISSFENKDDEYIFKFPYN